MSVVSSKLDAKRVETVSPAGSAESSLMAASEADPDARGASLTAVIEVSSSTVEEEDGGARLWIGINGVSVDGSCGGVIDQSCGQSAWSAVEVGGGKEAEFGGAFEEESVVVVEAGGGDVGPRGGSIGLPLPSALSCRGGIRGDDDAGE